MGLTMNLIYDKDTALLVHSDTFGSVGFEDDDCLEFLRYWNTKLFQTLRDEEDKPCENIYS